MKRFWNITAAALMISFLLAASVASVAEAKKETKILNWDSYWDIEIHLGSRDKLTVTVECQSPHAATYGGIDVYLMDKTGHAAYKTLMEDDMPGFTPSEHAIESDNAGSHTVKFTYFPEEEKTVYLGIDYSPKTGTSATEPTGDDAKAQVQVTYETEYQQNWLLIGGLIVVVIVVILAFFAMKIYSKKSEEKMKEKEKMERLKALQQEEEETRRKLQEALAKSQYAAPQQYGTGEIIDTRYEKMMRADEQQQEPTLEEQQMQHQQPYQGYPPQTAQGYPPQQSQQAYQGYPPGGAQGYPPQQSQQPYRGYPPRQG